MIDVAQVGTVGALVAQPGGQGSVHYLPDKPGHLLKLYGSATTVDVTALEELCRFPDRLTGADKALLSRATAWPMQVVDVGGGKVGVVLPVAPDRFFHTVEGDRKPRGLDWAFRADSCRFAGLSPASPVAAVVMMRQICQVFDLFSRHHVAYGDVSGNNLLWSGGRRPEVFFIDCDSASFVGQPRALPAAWTLLWDCPWSAAGDLEQDAYKFSLLFLRLYWHYEGTVSATSRDLILPADPPVTSEIVELLESGLKEQTSRPSPGNWAAALGRLEQALRRRAA